MMPSTAVTFDIAALTDKGIKRSANEDAYGLFDLPGMDAAIVVADGMGGLQAGDVASEESVAVMEDALRERIGAGDAPEAALKEAFTRANARVYAIAERVRLDTETAAKQAEADMPTAKRGDYSKTAPVPKSSAPLMGATVVAALVQGNRITIAHAGDSRLYRLRADALESLTFDHSFVAERVRSGDITEAEARVSRFRNMITRAVGIDDTVTPEIRTETVALGDVLLLCTDGLNTMVDDDDIAGILRQTQIGKSGVTANALAAELVEAANKRGGSDNITAVVVRVLDAAGTAPVLNAAMPLTRSATTRAAVPEEMRPAPTSRPPIVDMEARPAPPRRGVSPFVWFLAAVGVLSLGLSALIATATDVRQNIGRLLAPPPAPTPVVPDKPVKGGTTGNTVTIRDYTKLTYAAPVDFGEQTFAVRGDILGYSPKAGIYFVKDTSGVLTYMSLDGKIANAAIGQPLQQPPTVGAIVPPSRVFVAHDLQGNTYISYSASRVIKKFNRAGSEIGKITSKERPEALTVDEDGNLYVIYDSEIKKLKAIPATGTAIPKPAPTKTP
ncbi:MAG: protein phosphatase 2C domain-containing protein [Armatimonadetes bacterium]|nr:protein phosphatase 2C domain-containing protein [Armatimonadota bacterium]